MIASAASVVIEPETEPVAVFRTVSRREVAPGLGSDEIVKYLEI